MVPYPPLLVPELTVEIRPEIEQLRSACLRAASSLTDSARRWAAVGVDRHGPVELAPGTVGTFAGYGVDVPVDFGGESGVVPDPLLPLPALVAGWLRGEVGADEVTTHLLGPETPAAECREFGARLARDGEPVGLLVLADGSACRRERSPYPPDDRAEEFDEDVRQALATADPDRLLRIDSRLAQELHVEGRAALQVLAGALQATGAAWEGDVLYSGTPFGVTYHVAVCSRRDA